MLDLLRQLAAGSVGRRLRRFLGVWTPPAATLIAFALGFCCCTSDDPPGVCAQGLVGQDGVSQSRREVRPSADAGRRAKYQPPYQIGASKPVLYIRWAKWCGPCRSLRLALGIDENGNRVQPGDPELAQRVFSVYEICWIDNDQHPISAALEGVFDCIPHFSAPANRIWFSGFTTADDLLRHLRLEQGQASAPSPQTGTGQQQPPPTYVLPVPPLPGGPTYPPEPPAAATPPATQPTPGPRGPAGQNGAAGQAGQAGAIGPQGPAGAPGPAGPPGVNGSTAAAQPITITLKNPDGTVIATGQALPGGTITLTVPQIPIQIQGPDGAIKSKPFNLGQTIPLQMFVTQPTPAK